MSVTPTDAASPACGVLRRIGAMTYDSLLLLAVLFVATMAVLPLTGGYAISSGNLLYSAYLLLVCYGYFAWQWVHGGRTLGMRAWHLQLRMLDGTSPGWSAASVRFAAALLCWLPAGMGFLTGITRPDRLAWPDRLSRTLLTVTQQP